MRDQVSLTRAYVYITSFSNCFRSLDAIIPITFFIFSLAINTYRRYRTWRSARYRHYDPHTLRLPTSKDAHLLRRSLILLVLILLEISCWAFLFAWRLESAILERGQGSNNDDDNNNKKCGTPLYQVVDPGFALIPRVSEFVLFYFMIINK